MTIKKLFLVSISTLVLTACGSTASKYQPVVDGPKDAQYQTDLASCSSLSEERSYTNDDVKSEALLGAGIGAVIGAVEDGGEGAVAGAIAGGLIGGGERAWETRDERKGIIIECMRLRGHRVVG